MYQDDALFEKAMALLYRKYQRRGNLLKVMTDVIVLDTSTIPLFGTLSALAADLQDFMYLIRTYAVWGVGNKISGRRDELRI